MDVMFWKVYIRDSNWIWGFATMGTWASWTNSNQTPTIATKCTFYKITTAGFPTDNGWGSTSEEPWDLEKPDYKLQGIATSPLSHLMSTKASFAWLAYRIHSNFCDKVTLNGLWAMDHACLHLGAVHLGTPGVGIVDGSLALAGRQIDFFNLPIPIPCATQWKWFSRGWPTEWGQCRTNPSLRCYIKSLNVYNACVCHVNAKTKKQHSVIFRVITAGVYQCQQHELMSTGINQIVVRGISDGQSWGTTCHKAISNRM